jgi:hypothetical protein
MALDSGDDPMIVFFQTKQGSGAVPGAVRSAWRSGGMWNVQDIESMTIQNRAGASMAYDSTGSPRACYSYHDLSLQKKGELRYAKKAGGSWATESVVQGMTWGPSLAIGSDDHPVISFFQTPDPQSVLLQLAAWDGMAWNVTTVATWATSPVTGGSILLPTSLALDSADRVHISYHDPVGQDLMYYAEP